MRGRSLALRLAGVFAVVVVGVLLVAGLVVNGVTSRTIDETLGPREQQQLELAGDIIKGGLERGTRGHGLRMLLEQLARQTRGEVRLVAPDGSVRYATGDLPDGIQTESLTRALSSSAGGGALEIVVPSARAGFSRAFTAALAVTGIVVVLSLLLAATIVSDRLTRPLRAVAQAAHRLGAGDLGARAEGGPDAESAELAAAFNEMATQLERSEALRRRAASDLAHDLATPATVLESQIQAMVDGVVPADAAELERARAAAASLSSVIGQLGELTQAEAAPLQRQPQRVQLADLARDAVAALEGMLRERETRAVVEGPATAAVVADPGQLARALRNVLANAVQHSPAGAEVRITVAPGSIRVADAGPGIASEDLPFVFERFYRADPSRGGARSGSGIGLTVARELVAANGGSIEVERTGADGTTFLIRLPSAA
jgi:two-component system sensor histidine kinase BaeS